MVNLKKFVVEKTEIIINDVEDFVEFLSISNIILSQIYPIFNQF